MTAGEPRPPQRPAPDRSATDRPASDRPASDRPASDRPASDLPASDLPASDRPASGRPGSDRSGPNPSASDRPGPAGPAPDHEPLLPDGALLALLVLDGVLLAAAGLAFTPLYVGGVPAPVGALASIVLLPWLVGRAADVVDRPGWAAAPLTAWALTIGVLGLAGPGGDALLPVTWQSLLLLFGGLGAGLWRLRRGY